MAIIIVILVIYMAGMLAIGFAGKKKSETMTDFLTAGKSGGMFVMVCTYIGAHVGNGIVVGGAQYGAEYGIGGVWFGLGACLSYVLFALVMSRLLYTRGYITIPDLIRDRYKSKFASVLMAVLNICATLGIMAAQIMAGCALFEAWWRADGSGCVYLLLYLRHVGRYDDRLRADNGHFLLYHFLYRHHCHARRL